MKDDMQGMTYEVLYKKGAEYLRQAGLAEAELDARLLLEFICHTDRQTLLAHGDREVTGKEEEAYLKYIEKRASHVPLQHLTGSQNFMGLDFLVSEQALIPRQDTEVLVEEAMRYLHDGMRILDLCTGSGCILLSLLHYSNDCVGIGTDVSEAALLVARENAGRLEMLAPAEAAGKALFVQGDLFEAAQGKFDMIVSNPPYIATAVIKTLMPEVRDHEPLAALDGGEDGLFFYRRIAQEAAEHLNGGGMLFLEIGYDQAQAVMELLSQAGFQEVTLVQDFAGNDRVVHATNSSSRHDM